MTESKQPVIFISHGGGPCFWIEFPEPFGPNAFDSLRKYLEGLVDSLPQRPKAFVIISGHWEAEKTTVSLSAKPPMLFDYYNFPPHTYELNYPAPGEPELGQEIVSRLQGAGIDVATDSERGFDHGVFVPFLIVDPKGDIPVVMVSLRDDLDPSYHIAVGRALAPLRDENIAIIGSGLSYHNLSEFRDGEGETSRVFDAWLTDAVQQSDPSKRDELLKSWGQAPMARACHPREDHLIPLMVVAGAAEDDVGRADYSDVIGGKKVSGFRFGA